MSVAEAPSSNMPYEDRFKLIASVYAFLIRDGRILLLRRQNTGYEDGNFGLVAGHHDGCETLRQAMQREAREEAGLVIGDNDLELALTMHRWCGDHERLDVFFAVNKWQGEIANAEPDKCSELTWFPLDRLPENIIGYIAAAIDCFRRGEKYCEFGWAECRREE